MEDDSRIHNEEQSNNEQSKGGKRSRSLLHTEGLIPCSQVASHSEGRDS
jgi:hypothetical protein